MSVEVGDCSKQLDNTFDPGYRVVVVFVFLIKFTSRIS